MQPSKQLQLALILLGLAGVVLTITGLFTLFSYDEQTTQGSLPAGHTTVAAKAPAEITDPIALQGKQLFSNNCQSCHAVSAEIVVGPGLQGVTKRRPEEWIIHWVKNSQQVIASNDPYAQELYKKFNQAPMPSFNLSEDEIKSILTYISVAN